MAIDDYVNDEDTELDGSEPKPYDSIASRPDSVSQSVMRSVASRMSPGKDLQSDPLMQDYMKDQASTDEYRQAKRGSDFISNVGTSLAQLARGGAAPAENPVYKQIAQQNASNAQDISKDRDIRRKVMDSIETRNSREQIAKENRLARQETAAANRENSSLRRQELNDARTDRLMTGVGSRMENDPVLRPSMVNLASLDKARGILSSNVPLTSQVLSDAEQDIANALSLRGTGATEGKIKRTEMETLGRKIAELKQEVGNKPVDLRKEAPEIVEQIKVLNEALTNDYVEAINKRREQIVNNQKALLGNNKETGKRLDAYLESNRLQPLSPAKFQSQGTYQPGQLVRVQGKLYKVAADGDSLEEVM
jgi:hypothetical protein